MGYSAADFGYSFLEDKEAAEDLESGGTERDEKVKNYLRHKSDVQHLVGSTKPAKADDDNATQLAIASTVSCCCSLMAILIVIGTLMYTYDNYKSEPPYVKAGVVLIGLGIICCCCACTALCTAPFAQIKSKKGSSSEIEWDLKRLNALYADEEEVLDSLRLDVASSFPMIKKAKKEEKKKATEAKKHRKKALEDRIKADLKAGLSTEHIKRKSRPCAFKIVFEGDIQVSTMEMLREQISLAIKLGTPGLDQVVVCIDSPGGAVSMYGLAASQLLRIKKAGLKLVVCVDSIAASGGYLMGVTADKIYAAPFALVGSIGVISIVPNVHELLKKHDVNTHVVTAGKYKSTVNVVGPVTDEGLKKFQQELEDIHVAFKDHIVLNRPAMKDSIDEVATGEAYLAVQAKQKGLIDDIVTSDEYLESISESFDIILLQEKKKKSLFPIDFSELALNTPLNALLSTSRKESRPLAM